jgi:hypothetical protein
MAYAFLLRHTRGSTVMTRVNRVMLSSVLDANPVSYPGINGVTAA